MAEKLEEPKLDVPGAGLPWLERTVLNAVLRLYAALMPKRRVLIARRPGLEDNSRFWSPFMVLEHMAIVAEGVAGLMLALDKGRDPGREVRIQDVKPSPEVGPESIERLRGVVDHYARLVDRLGELRGPASHPHPWFGPLNARQWLCLAAVHNGVHRRQLRAIIRGMPAA